MLSIQQRLSVEVLTVERIVEGMGWGWGGGGWGWGWGTDTLKKTPHY